MRKPRTNYVKVSLGLVGAAALVAALASPDIQIYLSWRLTESLGRDAVTVLQALFAFFVVPGSVALTAWRMVRLWRSRAI